MFRIFPRKSLWKSVRFSLTDTFAQMRDGDIRLVASSLAFSTLLAIVPFIAVTISVFKQIGGLEYLAPKVEGFVLSYLQEATGQQAIVWIQKILKRIQSGAVGTTGFLALVLTSFKLLHDMEIGINRVWNVKVHRSIHKKIFFNSFLMVMVPLALAIYVSLRSLNFIKSEMKGTPLQFLDFLLMFSGIFFLYKMVPHLKVKIRPALLSAALASTLIYVLKYWVTWLTVSAFNYSKVYGSLAALPLLCLWILGIWYILLAGVAFCASTQRRHWLEENYGFDFNT